MIAASLFYDTHTSKLPSSLQEETQVLPWISSKRKFLFPRHYSNNKQQKIKFSIERLSQAKQICTVDTERNVPRLPTIASHGLSVSMSKQTLSFIQSPPKVASKKQRSYSFNIAEFLEKTGRREHGRFVLDAYQRGENRYEGDCLIRRGVFWRPSGSQR